MLLPSRSSIEAAARRLEGVVRRTPVVTVEPGPLAAGPLTLKLEQLQHSGSFKARGAANLLLCSPEARRHGVVGASGGNFGLALAWAAQRLGVRATIVLPEVTSEAKRRRLDGYGAVVVTAGALYDDARLEAEAIAARTGAVLGHAYDLPPVVEGAGTLARELDDQAPDLDVVLVAVGGGGLIGGVASWYGGRVRVVGVETVGTPTLRRALDAGAPVPVEVEGVAADSLGARTVGAIGFAAATRWVDDVVLVTDDDVAAAQDALWRELRVVAEPGGAAALAAVRSGAWSPAAGEGVGVVVCGANTAAR